MKKFIFIPTLLSLIILIPQFACSADQSPVSKKEKRFIAVIPLGGNTFITAGSTEGLITNKGLGNWKNESTVASIYFKPEIAGELHLSIRGKVAKGSSKLKVSVNDVVFHKEVSNTSFDTLEIGKIKITTPGYVHVDLQGISKTGESFAEVSDLIIEGSEPAINNLVYVKENANGGFHFGRRGPSVHLKFNIPEADKENIEWFYNEITVPQGEDVIGSYYMANGFSGGYFGIQVNSPTERRILFSIWSPYQTDDPQSIPDSLKIKLLKKGEGVYTGEFGNEGSGGQSFLRYPWRAGVTYAFLTRAQPNAAKNTTIFTSYFKDPNEGNWKLIASFERPKTNTSLKGIYSFLENFNPATGNIERHVNFGNQWAVTKEGKWHEITTINFTADNTAGNNYRKDYSGGVKEEVFYLRNCGFFNDYETINKLFTRKSTADLKPAIKFSLLP